MALTTGISGAQTAKDAAKAFRVSIANQQLILRNFSGEAEVHAHWTGTKIVWNAPRWHSLGALTLDSVSVKDYTVLLRGVRATLVRDEKTGLVPSSVTQDVLIEVDVDGDTTAALAQLRSALFYESVSNALAAVPELLQANIPAERSVQKSQLPLEKCDCADAGTPVCDGKEPLLNEEPPKTLHLANPTFSDQASQRRISGNVSLDILLDATGDMYDLWLRKPLGYGLDEQAISAARQYRFSPQLCHGKGAPGVVQLEFHFEAH